MAYTSPTVTGSSITFAQMQASGAAGHLEKLIAANNTLTSKQLELARAARQGRLQDVFGRVAAVVRNYDSGRPQAQADAKQVLLDAHWTFAILAALCAEAGTLVDANAGTLTTRTDGIGLREPVRTFP